VDWCCIPIVRVQTERSRSGDQVIFRLSSELGFLLCTASTVLVPYAAHAISRVLASSPTRDNDMSKQSALAAEIFYEPRFHLIIQCQPSLAHPA